MVERAVTGRGVGSPDHIINAITKVMMLRSLRGTHFTSALAQGESESANLAGLESNQITITGIRVISKQALHYRLLLYSKDTFGDSDLKEDSFLGSVDLDLSTYSKVVALDLI